MTKKDAAVFLLCMVLGMGCAAILKMADIRNEGIFFDLSKAAESVSAADVHEYFYEENTREKYGKVNINTAGVEELDQLPGIGKKMAERIIIFRNTQYRFGVPQEIMKVRGIGQKTYEALKDDVCTE